MDEEIKVLARSCSVCHRERPLHDFYKHPYGYLGRRSQCRQCYGKSAPAMKRVSTSFSPEEALAAAELFDAIRKGRSVHQVVIKRADDLEGVARKFLAMRERIGI